MSLKDRILKAIEHKQCSIPELAAAAGVRAPSVHGWVNGDSKSLKAGPAIKAAAFLGVSPLWLAEGEGEMLANIPGYVPTTSTPVLAAEKTAKRYHQRPLIKKLCDLAESIDDTGVTALVEVAQCFTRTHPLAKTKAA